MKQDFILMLINKTINYQHYGTKTTSAFKDETHKKYFEPKAIKIKCFEWLSCYFSIITFHLFIINKSLLQMDVPNQNYSIANGQIWNEQMTKKYNKGEKAPVGLNKSK